MSAFLLARYDLGEDVYCVIVSELQRGSLAVMLWHLISQQWLVES